MALQFPVRMSAEEFQALLKMPPMPSFAEEMARIARRSIDDVVRQALSLWVSELEPELMFSMGEPRPFGVTAKGHGTPYIVIKWGDKFYMTGEPIRHVVALRATIAAQTRGLP